jgi:hypothetical protein
MGERVFNTSDWVTECPPDYDTMTGWLARNSPAVLEDLVERFTPFDLLYKVLWPELSKASVLSNGEAFLVKACPALHGSDFQTAYPIDVLNEVFSKDTYITP